MKIIFHEHYLESYDSDPAAEEGRLDRAMELLKSRYEFLEPVEAHREDVLLVHSEGHLDRVNRMGSIYYAALLAAGGAVLASKTALDKEPAFALIRPPGHHAGRDSSWGFCWFNNMAIAVQRLIHKKRIKSAFILDFDLHFGDGTQSIFMNRNDVVYQHMGDMEELPEELSRVEKCDIIGLSAGFDRHIEDWGGLLSTDDYREIGRQVAGLARRTCPGRIFAVLEGGYNHQVLGENIIALAKGLEM